MANREAILGVLSFGPQSGYEIQQELAQGGAWWIWRLSYGSIYPILAQLVEEGLIAVVEEQSQGRQRKRYDLTGAGWSALDEWLKEEPDFPLPLNDELMLRLLFWGTGCPEDRTTLIKHLDERAAKARDLLRRVNSGGTATDEYQGLLEDYARYRLRAEVTWAEEAIAQLEGPARPPLRDPHGLFDQAARRRALARQRDGAQQEQKGQEDREWPE